MDSEDECWYLANLLALLACHLDEHPCTSDREWKTKVIEHFYSDNEQARGFLHAWVSEGVVLDKRPILNFFSEQARMYTMDEQRRRANSLRGLMEAIVCNVGRYDSRVRVSLKHMCVDLDVDWNDNIVQYETILARRLIKEAREKEDKRSSLRRSSSTFENWSYSRIAKVGGIAVLGGTLVGLTAGAAAPLFAPLVGAAFATSTAVATGLVTGLFSLGGGGLMGYRMAERTRQDLDEFFFENVSQERDIGGEESGALQVVIAVAGTMYSNSLQDLSTFWWNVFESQKCAATDMVNIELYQLIFDRDPLVRYTNFVVDMLKDKAYSIAKGEVLKHVVGHAIMAAVALPLTIVNWSSVLNNKFVTCESRSRAAGRELARALEQKFQGSRPVSLVGHGFGGLVVVKALEELAESDTLGVVEDVLVAGAPLRVSKTTWEKIRRVVAGKLVNCYCSDDWSLAISMQLTVSSDHVAGLKPVDLPGLVEDHQIDFSHSYLGTDGGLAMQMLVERYLMGFS